MADAPLHILFFTDHFPPEPSAPAAHIWDRARIWARDGHRVTIVASHPNAPIGQVYDGYRNVWRSIEDLDGVRVVRVKTLIAPNSARSIVRFLDYISYFLSALLQALREPKPQVVISSSPHIFVPLAGVMYSMIRRVPHVFEIRDLWPATIAAVTSLGRGFGYRMLERLELWMYARSRRLIPFTRSFVEDMTSRGVPADKIDLVYNGANLDLFSPVTSKDPALTAELGLEGKVVFGFLGTLGLAQDLSKVLDAAALIEHPDVHVLFVGASAEEEKLRQRVLDEGLTNVTFGGRQEKKDMPRYWSLCDVSLIHLKDDPLFRTVIPSKIFESMAVGLPMLFVAPEGSEGGEIVETHEVGLVVPSGDVPALATAMERMAGDPGLRRAMGAASARPGGRGSIPVRPARPR
ncbi:MAG: glycosyltransferase family 4 protein, partial [Pseudomonadota bacterium]